MCNYKSMVVTKGRVFVVPGEDGHENIIDQYNLHEENSLGQPNVVRVEMIPPDGWTRKAKLNLKAWRFNIDQEYLPGWANRLEIEQRCRQALADYAKKHIKKAGKALKLKADEYWTEEDLNEPEVVRLVLRGSGSHDMHLVVRKHGGHDGEGELKFKHFLALQKKGLRDKNLWWVDPSDLSKTHPHGVQMWVDKHYDEDDN